MRKLFYIGLEPYEGRYTLQLTDWNERVFKRRGLDYEIIQGRTIDDSKSINVGQVLDAHGRTFFALSQMMELVQKSYNNEFTCQDVIYFEDMFHPGIEALAYIKCQIDPEKMPAIFVRCLAQTIDPDDFVHYTGMDKWMKKYEEMTNEFVDGILASNEEMVAHMRIAGWNPCTIYNISGLAFGKEEVIERVGKILPWEQRKDQIVFAARFDMEKQPGFFMNLVKNVKDKHENIQFVICSGGPFKSNIQEIADYARKLEDQGYLAIKDNLSKEEYYKILNESKLLFNCALQDWTSNTVSEADALGCNVLFPAYRSFPEIFANDHERMFVPWSLEDAYQKLINLIEAPHEKIGKISDWTNGTIDRIVDILEGADKSSFYERSTESNYRMQLLIKKYR